MNSTTQFPLISQSSTHAAGHVPIPISREQFDADVLLIYIYWARVTALLAGATSGAIWLKQPLADASDLFDPDFGPEEFGMRFEHIADLDFAKYSGWMYDYGIHAIDHASAESMGDETPYTWFSAHVFDLSNGTLPELYTNDGGDATRGAANRWLTVAELANARNILEGGESFFHFSRLPGAEDAGGSCQLTFRQLALLAGIDEMSVRMAANPKRPDALRTITELGHAFVPIEVARAWLERKRRHIPVRINTDRSRVDLAAAEISGPADLVSLLDQRIHEIRKYDSDQRVWRRLEQAGVVEGDGIAVKNLLREDGSFIGVLAQHLDIDVDILRLRVREALAKETLSRVSREVARIALRA